MLNHLFLNVHSKTMHKTHGNLFYIKRKGESCKNIGFEIA